MCSFLRGSADEEINIERVVSNFRNLNQSLSHLGETFSLEKERLPLPAEACPVLVVMRSFSAGKLCVPARTLVCLRKAILVVHAKIRIRHFSSDSFRLDIPGRYTSRYLLRAQREHLHGRVQVIFLRQGKYFAPKPPVGVEEMFSCSIQDAFLSRAKRGNSGRQVYFKAEFLEIKIFRSLLHAILISP